MLPERQLTEARESLRHNRFSRPATAPAVRCSGADAGCRADTTTLRRRGRSAACSAAGPPRGGGRPPPGNGRWRRCRPRPRRGRGTGRGARGPAAGPRRTGRGPGLTAVVRGEVTAGLGPAVLTGVDAHQPGAPAGAEIDRDDVHRMRVGRRPVRPGARHHTHGLGAQGLLDHRIGQPAQPALRGLVTAARHRRGVLPPRWCTENKTAEGERVPAPVAGPLRHQAATAGQPAEKRGFGHVRHLAGNGTRAQARPETMLNL